MNKKTIHILLVEDNEGDILLLREAFEEANVDVNMSVVTNGQAALDFLHQAGDYKQAEKADLVLLDINLPVLNGHEVLKQVKSHAKLRTTPVIMLTTSSSPTDIETAYANQANSYITKPVDISDFLKIAIGIEKFWINIACLPSESV